MNVQGTINKQHRVFYIDALRAIAIILMVMIHIPQHYPFIASFYAPLGGLFSMPLFFAISGYMINLEHFHIHDRIKLLVPFFVIGLLYTFVCDKSFTSFFATMDKNGYWFLWITVLFSLFFCY